MKGLLLVNLGTPDSPRIWDVWRYLNEFLTDRRVIDLPWLKRQVLVRGLIVPSRVRSSAKLYREIWTGEGSPLLFHSRNMARRLQERLQKGWKVELAMRYRHPSIQEGLKKLQGCSEIVILPLFPQYAAATSGSIIEKAMEEIRKWPVIPPTRFIGPFYERPKVIQAYAAQAASFNLHAYDKILFSFHGLPVKQNYTYSAQCEKAATLLAQELNLAPSRWELSYQSRLGKDPWLEPYTSDVLKRLGKAGAQRLLVFSPAFVADCLETLQEIGTEYAAEFRSYGGERLDLVSSLNDSPRWIEALQEMINPEVL